MRTLAIGVAMLAFGGALHAQTGSTAGPYDLGGSMGTQSAAAPSSNSAAIASGAYQSPVAKAGRRSASFGPGTKRTSPGAATRAGDMTPSGNTNANQQH